MTSPQCCPVRSACGNRFHNLACSFPFLRPGLLSGLPENKKCLRKRIGKTVWRIFFLVYLFTFSFLECVCLWCVCATLDVHMLVGVCTCACLRLDARGRCRCLHYCFPSLFFESGSLFRLSLCCCAETLTKSSFGEGRIYFILILLGHGPPKRKSRPELKTGT